MPRTSAFLPQTSHCEYGDELGSNWFTPPTWEAVYRSKTTFPGDLCAVTRGREEGRGMGGRARLCVSSLPIGALSKRPCKLVGDWTDSCTLSGDAALPDLSFVFRLGSLTRRLSVA